MPRKPLRGACEAAEKANREATNARIAEQAAQARLESTAREIDGAKAGEGGRRAAPPADGQPEGREEIPCDGGEDR